MKKILDLITDSDKSIYRMGYDAKYARLLYQTDLIFVNTSVVRSAMATAKNTKAPFMIADEVVEKLLLQTRFLRWQNL